MRSRHAQGGHLGRVVLRKGLDVVGRRGQWRVVLAARLCPPQPQLVIGRLTPIEPGRLDTEQPQVGE